MSDTKPRVRIPAGRGQYTGDSFANFATGMGYGTQNLSSANTTSFTPLSRLHTQLEWLYRGSWLVRNVVDAVADDMTRAGVTFETDMPPDEMDKFSQYLNSMVIWPRLTSTIKWSRLYGGALAVVMIDGQKLNTPLNTKAIGKDQFKGLVVLDRWMCNPHAAKLVQEMGADFGLPESYEVMSGMPLGGEIIHHSRCIRLDGVELPYWQRLAENNWGISVIEPFYDRLMAFDSATTGASQLVYKSYLRTIKIKDLRSVIGTGGPGLAALTEQLSMIRLMQSNEGLTIIDSEDEFITNSYGFGGISDVIIQFAQQLSGAAQIPLVRLFGQSPAGLNATGESDIRNYYDAINAQQEARLRRPLHMVFDVAHRSLFGKALPDGFDFGFNPLWQITDEQKAAIAVNVANAVSVAHGDGLIAGDTAMKELRQSSKVTGIFSNITDEEIKEAEAMAPMPGELDPMSGMPVAPMAGAPGTPGQQQLQPGANQNMPGAGAAKPPTAHAVHAPSKAASSAADGLTTKIQGVEIQLEQPGRRYADPHTRSITLPGSYGYIEDSAQNKMPCLVGQDPDSQAVWIVQQNDPNTLDFEDLKVIVGTPDRESALELFRQSFVDGMADKRIGRVQRTNIAGLQNFLTEWRGSEQQHTNGKLH